MSTGIEFKIVKSYGVIGQSKKGWTTELNLVSWNNRTPKYDIRTWDSEHQQCGKGVTLTADELESLHLILHDNKPWEDTQE